MEVVDLKELSLKKVKITGDVIGKFGTFEIEQIYKNNTNDILEVGYTFPIVETATVVGFEINVGNRVLKGKCKEKGKAKKEYQKNIVKGNSAYMLEQETDNIFKISVGKIDRNEDVKIKIQYIDKFQIIDNIIQIFIPTLVTPKYKSKITENLIYDDVEYTVDFNINVLKSLNVKKIEALNYKLNIVDEEKIQRINVINYDMSKDFKLNLELKNELTSNAIVSKTKNDEDMVYLSFMPEILDCYEDSEKEYLFIIDVSGSMMGEKLDETKRAVIECLKQLDVGDKFNIIPFESEFEAMNIKSIEYNEKNLEDAIKYVSNLAPLGGTEILEPIKFALYEKDVDKIILLFTDGQVGNEDEIIKFVDYNINRSRIFPFGIDTNVNSSFIKKLAEVGNGKAEIIQPKEKIDDKIIRTFARIQTPLLEEIIIDYGKNKVIDEIREEKCLFNYEFFNIFAKVKKVVDDIKLKGKILDKEYIWKINKEEIYHTNVDLELLFVKQEIERLEEYIRNTYDTTKIEIYKEMIIELAEKYNINSKYTSFITIYERENKILEVPRYEETRLSKRFDAGTFIDNMLKLTAKVEEEFDEDYQDEFESDDMMAMPFLRSDCSSKVSDIDMPCFIRKNVSENLKNKATKMNKLNKVVLDRKVNEYYDMFILQNEKSILTFLLYALYYLLNDNKNYKYDDLLIFLESNKDEILKNEKYLQVLYLYYKQLQTKEFFEKSKILKFIKDNFNKVTIPNFKMKVELKYMTKKEIKKICNDDRVNENIDIILEHLIKSN